MWLCLMCAVAVVHTCYCCVTLRSDEEVLADTCRTHILPVVKVWLGCDVLLLASAACNFTCRPALLHALLALASWYHVRSSNDKVDFPVDLS